MKPSTGWLESERQDRTGQSVVQIARMIGFVLQNPNYQLFAESVSGEVMQPTVTPDQAQRLLEHWQDVQLNWMEI